MDDKHIIEVPNLHLDLDDQSAFMRVWSPQEVEYLKKEFANGTRVYEICKALNRPYYSVKEKIRAMGLFRERT